ncbi:MAG: hypothetical protein GY757_28025, partial [bacterium]|nr:hypothetical protein [bacterium]
MVKSNQYREQYHIMSQKKSSQSNIVGYRYRNEGGETILPLPDTPEAIELPEETLVLPARYHVDNKCFQLDEAGVYRFYSFGRVSEQRIVWKQEVTLEKLLGYLSLMMIYGNSDDSIRTKNLLKVILHR